jgi:hypothetical protein
MSSRIETFRTAWPQVLFEMKDYLDLFFLSQGRKRASATVTVSISRTLVPRSRLQPHVRDFRAAVDRIPDCKVEFKATEEPAHKIEIEYSR